MSIVSSVFTDLGARVIEAFTGDDLPAKGSGLDVVEHEIDEVLTTLRSELTALQKNNFEVEAFIPGKSFGAGSEAATIAQHHARAHGVVVDTLKEMITDLETFRVSIVHAKGLIGEADAQAQADLSVIMARAENLDLGHQGHEDAQVNHVNDTASNDRPTPQLPASATDGTSGDPTAEPDSPTEPTSQTDEG